MTESLAAVRETVSAKSKSDGNLVSDRGGVSFTSTTTTTTPTTYSTETGTPKGYNNTTLTTYVRVTGDVKQAQVSASVHNEVAGDATASLDVYITPDNHAPVTSAHSTIYHNGSSYSFGETAFFDGTTYAFTIFGKAKNNQVGGSHSVTLRLFNIEYTSTKTTTTTTTSPTSLA